MRLTRTITFGTLFLIPLTVLAQVQNDAVPLRPWPAPLYWQPTQAENQIAAMPATFGNAVAEDTRPANSLVFVGMTPCRVVDTRTGSGFAGAFGPPSLVGGAKRTFPIQSSATCSIPSIAQAYSFNITIVPPGFVDFVTVGPTPVSTPPTFSTLNGYVCAFSSSPCVISNAAIVPAGTSGSVDVYASQTTNLIMDINGYYAQQTGISLAQGAAGTPSLSFAGDPGTGIFSSGPGSLDITSGGVSRLTLRSDGDFELPGSLRKGGVLFLHNLGTANTSVGRAALGSTGNALGSNNTAVGESALFFNTGNDNTAAGTGALSHNTSGSDNTAQGMQSLYSNTTGQYNTASGVQALYSNTTGYRNTAGGYESLFSNNTGFANTATGFGALFSNTIGTRNTATGDSALFSNSTGSNNTAVGFESLPVNTTGNQNTALGDEVLHSNTTGGRNTGSGFLALYSNTNGADNVAIGGQALYANTTGSRNTAIGDSALGGNTSGFDNTATGYEALKANSSNRNTATGHQALTFNSIGGSNTADGHSALYSNQNGSNNTASGYHALYSNDGNGNTAAGSNALQNTTTGDANVGMGAGAGTANTTGFLNTAIGYFADFGSSSLSHATAIGAGAIAPGSNQVQIGRNGLDVVSIGFLGSAAATHICMVNSIFSSCSSSRRYKENIEPFSGSFSLLERLRPVTFDWKGRKEHDLGLIAEEVFEVEPLLVTRNDKGEIEGVKYEQLTVVLINAIKEQQQLLLQQQEQNRKLEERLAALEALLSGKAN
jgi:trimeric autotransporter adhesin